MPSFKISSRLPCIGMSPGSAVSSKCPSRSSPFRSLLRKLGKRVVVLILTFIGAALLFNNGNLSSNFLIASSEDTIMKLINPMKSYCSEKADRRGLNQNVISFALYGNFSDPNHYNRYAGAIKYIMTNITQVYPGCDSNGWVMRIYSALEPDGCLGTLKLQELFESYSFVDLCNVTRVLELRNITQPLFPMTWRFLPLMDPTVDRILSRDTDSLITAREVAAVNQWLNSNSTFHMMHDHPLHRGHLLLGGMWGSKIFRNRQVISKAASSIFYDTKHEIEKSFDQTMLEKYISPVAFNDSMHHASFCCEYFKTSIPFPTKRLDAEYVGQVFHESASEELEHKLPEVCPEKCRPIDHPDWTRC